MNSLYEMVKRFLCSLGSEIGEQGEEPMCNNLPLFITAAYDFCKIVFLGQEFLLAMVKNQKQLLPEQIIAQKKLLNTMISRKTLFVLNSGSKEFCRILIKAQVPFIIPGRQIFVPESIMMIQEDKFNRTISENRKQFSPLAQVILLYHLLNKDHENELAFQDLLHRLNLNKVYLSRSVKELEQVQIAEIVTIRHRKKLVFVSERKSIWDNYQDKLTSPVIKRIRYEVQPQNGLIAGITALSENSLLSDDSSKTFAIYGRGFKINESALREFSGFNLELWKYDPRLLSNNGKTVDKLSLFLSLKNDSDPRVSGALQDMMEAFEW